MANVVTIPNNTNDLIQNFVATTLANRRQREAQAAQQQQAIQAAQERDQARQDMLDKAMAAQFLSLPPDQQAANISRLSDGARRFILDTHGFTPHTPTQEEILQQKRTQYGIEGYDDPSKLGPGGASAARYQVMTGASAPTDVVKANVANDVYSNPTGLAPQMQARQSIEDKTSLSAPEQDAATFREKKYNTIDLPVSRAEIAVKQADVGLKGAETKKVTNEAENDVLRRDPNSPLNAGRGATGNPSDAEAIADAIISGKQPPDLKGLYKMSGPVRAALATKGYDLTRATQDWTATQKYLSTLNGSQQVRLRQAVNFTYDSLDVVEQLAKEWKAGGFQVLNRARLNAAKQGLMGEQANSLATRLDAQIGDMVSELGTVYKGGNGSTDESLHLAAKNLSADWSEKTLMDSINQLRKNLGIRKNSIDTAGVAANTGNTYAPQPQTPTSVKPTGKQGDPMGLGF